MLGWATRWMIRRNVRRLGIIAWGKIKLQHDFEDTEKVTELDRYLTAYPELDLAAAAEAR